MKIKITMAILTLLLAAVFASCSGAFLDPGIEVVGLGGNLGGGSGEGKTPDESDYTVGNLSQTAGSVTAVTIKANSGKSSGAVKNIRYDHSTTIPQSVGSYYVTFDVEKALGWDAAYDLYAGTLIVNPTYTISFNLNGGTGTTPAPQTAGLNTSITLPGGTGFSRPDYVFSGWNTNTSGTGTNYSAGASYTINGNATLYAKWSSNAPGTEGNPIPLTEREWTNGSITASTENREVWYSFDVTAGSTYYVWWNDGYSGGGDGTKTLDVFVSASYSGGSSIFTDADSAWSTPRSFTATSTGTVKLKVYPYNSSSTGTFAILYSTTNSRPASYTVTFNINGGIGTTPASQTVTDTDNSITLPDGTGFSRTNYDFIGWNTNSSGTGTNYSAGASYTVTGNTTLYAKWVSNLPGSEGNPFPLTSDIWTNGNITTSTINREVWYSFDVTAGSTYYVWWNDYYQGNSTKTLDVRVSASYSNGAAISFTNDDSAWNTPQSFTATSTSTVKLRVYPYNSGTGTFAIVYSTSGTRPNPGDGTETNPFTLTSGVWNDGSITSSITSRAIWYSFDVVAGSTYYVWWNDGYSSGGNGTKTLDVKVSASYSSGSSIFTGVDSAWSTPQSFTASSTGTVKLKVEPYTSSNNGTFAIVYSASSTRP